MRLFKLDSGDDTVGVMELIQAIFNFLPRAFKSVGEGCECNSTPRGCRIVYVGTAHNVREAALVRRAGIVSEEHEFKQLAPVSPLFLRYLFQISRSLLLLVSGILSVGAGWSSTCSLRVGMLVLLSQLW